MLDAYIELHNKLRYIYVPYLMNSEDVNLELVFLGQAGPWT